MSLSLKGKLRKYNPSDPCAIRRLRAACERAKRTLSSSSEKEPDNLNGAKP